MLLPLREIQAYVARVAIGPSTVRGQGEGLVASARASCSSMPLDRFSTLNEAEFARRVDEATIEVQDRMPTLTRSWGMARKIVSIFLRDSLYNTYLNTAYSLQQCENFLELPLDSITVKYLKGSALPGALPRWRGIKYLTSGENSEFQKHAARQAASRQIARIHLDAVWWGMRPDDSGA
jgi:hypothetical protein